ncbi:MAG TPA: hypothetical protein VN260_02535 [Dissulfurispiraceae bacterium]|nr:hypothetical protein [Dissulfurispiraceae bacterium]
MEQKKGATEEQRAYSVLLDWGMKAGLLMLVISFAIYMSGILTPHVPVEKLPDYWGLSVHTYLERADVHPGWAWVGLVGKGDFLNFVGIAFLAGVTILCYARIIPIFFKKGDRIYGIIAAIEVLVLALAASGLLKAGGH